MRTITIAYDILNGENNDLFKTAMMIRPFKQSDTQALISLWRDLGLVTDSNDPLKDIDRKLKVNPELLLVAIKDARVIGSVMGGYEGHRGWVNYLAVATEFQRQGIATLLMQEVEAKLLLLGCPKINLQVRNSNDQVMAFYRALGYCDDKVVSFGKRLISDN